MPKSRDFNRLDRVASTVKRALAQPVNELARMQRAGLATVTAVEVSPDLRRAVVRLSVFGGSVEPHAFVAGLEERAGELQRVLARELKTKRTPVLRFVVDDSIARADRVNRLLGAAGAERE